MSKNRPFRLAIAGLTTIALTATPVMTPSIFMASAVAATVPTPKTVTTPFKVKEGGVDWPNAADAITNKEAFPVGTTYEWTSKPVDPNMDIFGPIKGVETQNAVVTVTVPATATNGIVGYEYISVSVPVQVYRTTLTSTRLNSEQYEPKSAFPAESNASLRVGAGGVAYPNPAIAFANREELPAGSTYEWTQKHDQDGGAQAQATVIYPDNSHDTVTVMVDAQEPDPISWLVDDPQYSFPGGLPYNPTLDADRYTPRSASAEPVVWYTQVDPSNYIDPNTIPSGSQLTFVPRAFTIAPGKRTETIVVTYPDGSSEKVSVEVEVKPTQADVTEPRTISGAIEVYEGGVGYPDAREVIGNLAEMPSGKVVIRGSENFQQEETHFVWVEKPTEVGIDQNATIAVQYPDGSFDLVEVKVDVLPAPKRPNGTQTLADTYEPTMNYVPNVKWLAVNTGARNYPDPAEAVANRKDLPVGTVYEWVYMPYEDGGDSGFVAVNYPDGSHETVKVSIDGNEFVVPSVAEKVDADIYTPVATVPADPLPQNTVFKPKEFIANASSLPSDSKFTFVPAVDTSTGGTKPTAVVVTYPDGSSDRVPLDVRIATDAESYDPKPADNVTVKQGDTVNPADLVDLTGLPDGTKVTAPTTVDTSTPGTKNVTVTVTYPDKTTDEVTVLVTVENPDTDAPAPTVDDTPTVNQVTAGDDKKLDGDKVINPTEGLTGTVTDKDGNPITDAEVTVDPTTGEITVKLPDNAPAGDAKVQIKDKDGNNVGNPINITIKPGAGTGTGNAGTGDTGDAKASSSVDGKCIATLVGWSLPLLALIPVGIALNAGIPVVEEAMRPVNEQLTAWNTQAQQQLGLFNPQLAEMANRYNQEIQMATTGLGVAAVAIGLIASIATTCGGAGSSNGSSR